ncbi:hypothetical protein AB7Z32_26725 [Bradyrhizobium sp. 482_C4_N1_1]|uniref:hypothetical protein n=1 Tax=unclassified Bradyrhizobium TaxID=2631580 RepID=UPI003F8C77F3
MRNNNTAVAALLAASSTFAMPSPSIASPICWIDRVTKAEAGVNVYFMQKAALRIMVYGAANGGSYTSSDGILRDASGHSRDHLFVKEGAKFYASQVVEDSCSYEVSVGEAVRMVTAKSAFALPGEKPAYTAQIIRTDGTVSRAWLLPESE